MCIKKKERRIREIETVEWRITREFHCRRGEEHAPKVKSRSKRSVASRRKNEHTKRYTDNHTRSHECTTFFQSAGSFRRRRNHHADKDGRGERMDIGWIVARLDLSVDDESLREFLKRKNVLSSTLNFSIYSSKESRFFFPVFFFPSLEHACNRERGMKTRQAKRNKISVHGGVKLQEESRGSKIYTS